MIPIAKPIISFSERRAVNRVLKSGNLAQGKEVSSFELEFESLFSSRKCVAVNSGTSGLHVSLLSLGIGKGDEVIVPSFSFAATANVVALTGAQPIFVDIDLNTFNIDVASVEAAINFRTKAIMPVHLYGLPANMIELRNLAIKHGILIIEDAAQAHLAAIGETPVGEFGSAATFSFYPTKNMTSGEGGMIVCESEGIARQCRLFRNQGMEQRYQNEIVGFNLRMSDIHAAIGRVQLTRLTKWTEKRIHNANFLSQNLEGVITPTVPQGYRHVFHQYTIRLEGMDRDRFSGELSNRGIGNSVYYPNPIHKLPAFNSKLDLPNTSVASKTVISLPIHPSLKERELELIAKTVNQLARAGS
jgi:perosamine synthetase